MSMKSSELIVRLRNRIFCKHDWRFDLPDASVSAQDWSGAKFGCVCRKCSAMDFRELPQAKLKPKLNALELVTFHRIQQLTKHGCKYIDIEIRKDGNVYHFQGDWLSGHRQ